jgi:GTPase SAR1 family protein
MAWCVLSPEDRLQVSISKNIEKRLQRDRSIARREIKILLLGTGESGKSTFIKQMRIIHGKGFTEEDKRSYKTRVYSNVVLAIQTLVKAAKKMQLELTGQDHESCVHMLEAMDAAAVHSISQEECEAIKSLWKDGGIQSAYERRREFHLTDSAKYYLDDLDRVCGPEYIPSEQDVLRARAATQGLLEHKFLINKTAFTLVDVGGQRSERRKWIHAFEGVTAVIFFTAISEYDQQLRYEETDGEVRMSVGVSNVYRWVCQMCTGGHARCL